MYYSFHLRDYPHTHNSLIFAFMQAHLTHPVFKIISERASAMGVDAYVVGGWVRDLLLDRPCKDIDIVAIGSGIELAQEVAAQLGGQYNVTVFKNFGTAHIAYEDYDIEFVCARQESYRN